MLTIRPEAERFLRLDDNAPADVPITDWQQEAQRLRCILATLIRACHEVEETVPMSARLRLARALVEAEGGGGEG